MEIIDKIGDVTMTETMKKKYKLEKGQWGYAIDSILDKAIRVDTQFLVGKVMWNVAPMRSHQ